MSYILNATQVPAPRRSTTVDLLSDAENTTGTNGSYTGRKLTAGSTTLSSKWNRNLAAMELIARYACGIYCVISGLTFTATGLTLTFAEGQAIIDGPVEMDDPNTPTYVVPDNTARVFLWLKQDGTFTHTTNTTPPASKAVFLGTCVTSGGVVSSIDYSGVIYAKNGFAVRYTADAGEPGDTPSSELVFITVTAGGSYFWDGTEYSVGATADTISTLIDTIIQDNNGITWNLSGGLLTPTISTENLLRNDYPYNTETISATKTLSFADKNVQVLTASGADRKVLMPPNAQLNPGRWFRIINAGASNNIIVRDNGDTSTIVTLTPGLTRTFQPKWSGGSMAWPTSDPVTE